MADQKNDAATAKPEAQAPAPKPAAAAEPAKAADTPKADAPKAEAPKAEAAKPEPAKAAAPRTKAAKPAARKARAKAPAAKSKAPAKRKPAAKAAKAAKPAAAAAVARTISKTIKEGNVEMNKQTKKTVETGAFAADQFQAVFGDVNERAKTAVERSSRVVEELTDLTRGNVEALVASSKIAARAVETLSQEAADYGRRSFEEASATLKSFAEVKSPTDFFRLQSEYARSAFDSAVAESSKMSEAMIKIAGEVAQPITSRYSVAAERVKNLAA
jgi:phasin family protein